MKNINALVTIVIFIFLAVSCDEDDAINFYNSDYRTGLWITADKTDTLDFIDDSRLVRKGFHYSHEEYSYLIEGKTLVIISNYKNEEIRTHHSIAMVDKNVVLLGNMYITVGFADNSSTFYKE